MENINNSLHEMYVSFLKSISQNKKGDLKTFASNTETNFNFIIWGFYTIVSLLARAYSWLSRIWNRYTEN